MKLNFIFLLKYIVVLFNENLDYYHHTKLNIEYNNTFYIISKHVHFSQGIRQNKIVKFKFYIVLC